MFGGKRGDQGPTLLLLIVGAALIALVVKRGGSWAQAARDALKPIAGRALAVVTQPGLALAVVLLVAVVVVVRSISTRRTLSSRVSFSVLPTDSFDPSDQSVSLFSRQLSAVPRVVRGWTDRRASAVRVRLGSAGEGRMLYSLEAPARSRSALQAAAGAYDEVELRPAETVDLTGLSALSLEPGRGEEPEAELGDARRGERGDGADPLGVDDREALGDVPEASPWWDEPDEGRRG